MDSRLRGNDREACGYGFPLARERQRDDRCKAAPLFLLAPLHHAGAVFVELLHAPVDWLIFPASPLHSRSAFSRSLLIPVSPCSLRCAKLGVARVEAASPNASAAAPYLFLRIIIDFLPMRPTSRGNAPGRKSLAATARQSRKPAGRNAQERLQNRHVTRAMRGMCVGALERD